MTVASAKLEARTSERGTRNGERQRFRNPQSAIRNSTIRSAFTLVELLVTMVIIGILAAITLGALQKAYQAADIAKTRSLIAQLHGQMMVRWESYRTRRVPINTSGKHPAQAAADRLSAMRELMRFELPERYTDIYDSPVVPGMQPLPKPPSPSWFNPMPPHGGVSSISSAFLRRCLNNTDPKTGAAMQPTTQYEGAECLYMILTMSTEDDFSGAEQFKPKDIGDADGDGMLEFHDAWGQPIEFLRWAPGFISDIQPSLDPTDDGSNFSVTDFNLHPRQPNSRHDPMDPLKLQKEAFTLFPLIYSGGLDRQTDIARQPYNTSVTPPTPHPNWTTPTTNNNPYFSLYLSSPYEYAVGAPADIDDDDDEGWADNIHNHLIGLR